MVRIEPGDRVELIEPTDPYTLIEPDDRRTIESITVLPPELAGGHRERQIWVEWDRGTILAVIPEGGDLFQVIGITGTTGRNPRDTQRTPARSPGFRRRSYIAKLCATCVEVDLCRLRSVPIGIWYSFR